MRVKHLRKFAAALRLVTPEVRIVPRKDRVIHPSKWPWIMAVLMGVILTTEPSPGMILQVGLSLLVFFGAKVFFFRKRRRKFIRKCGLRMRYCTRGWFTCETRVKHLELGGMERNCEVLLRYVLYCLMVYDYESLLNYCWWLLMMIIDTAYTLTTLPATGPPVGRGSRRRSS